MGSRIGHILDGGRPGSGLSRRSSICATPPPRPPEARGHHALRDREGARRARRELQEFAGRGPRAPRPGQMPRHYSPRTRVVLHTRLTARAAAGARRTRRGCSSQGRAARGRGEGTCSGSTPRATCGARRGGSSRRCASWTTDASGGSTSSARRRRPRGGPERPPRAGVVAVAYRTTCASSVRNRSFCSAVPTVTRIHSGSS